jgi:hypothetical protein
MTRHHCGTSTVSTRSRDSSEVRFGADAETSTRAACAPRRQKFLARDAVRSEDRSAMSTLARSINHRRAFVAVCVSAAFVWALALSVSPQLHQRVHKDANRVEHNCAATMIASGKYDHAAHPPLVSAPAPSVQFSKIPALTPRWVESPFLGACIFEHAPPARG